jgi:hypothetical protein
MNDHILQLEDAISNVDAPHVVDNAESLDNDSRWIFASAESNSRSLHSEIVSAVRTDSTAQFHSHNSETVSDTAF